MTRTLSPHRLRARYHATQAVAEILIQVAASLAILLAAIPVTLGAILVLPAGLGIACLAGLVVVLGRVAWLALRGELDALSTRIYNLSNAAAYAMIRQPSRRMPLPFGELFVSCLSPWAVQLIIPGDKPGQRLMVGAAVPAKGGGFLVGAVPYATWTDACRALVFRAGTQGATAHQRMALQTLLLQLPADPADWPFQDC